jgi:hypothetical protein
MSLTKIQKLGTTECKKRGRESDYSELLNDIQKLKANQEAIVEVPKGVEPRVYRNRIGVRIRYAKPPCVDGCYYGTGLSKDEKTVLVLCIQGTKPPAGNRGKNTKTKGKRKAK